MNTTLDSILSNVPTTTTTQVPSASEFKKLVKSSVRGGNCVSNPEGRCAVATSSCSSGSGCGDGGTGCGGGCGGGGDGVGPGGSL